MNAKLGRVTLALACAGAATIVARGAARPPFRFAVFRGRPRGRRRRSSDRRHDIACALDQSAQRVLRRRAEPKRRFHELGDRDGFRESAARARLGREDARGRRQSGGRGLEVEVRRHRGPPTRHARARRGAGRARDRLSRVQGRRQASNGPRRTKRTNGTRLVRARRRSTRTASPARRRCSASSSMPSNSAQCVRSSAAACCCCARASDARAAAARTAAGGLATQRKNGRLERRLKSPAYGDGQLAPTAPAPIRT